MSDALFQATLIGFVSSEKHNYAFTSCLTRVYNAHNFIRDICVFKYRLMMALAWLVVPFVCLQRIMTGKDSFATFKARFGFGQGRSANARLIWLHAASLGEFNTLELLLPALSEKFSTYDLLITVSNKLAFERAKNLASGRVHVEIAPLDFSSVINRFLARWQPSCMITIENEVYPNRIFKAAQQALPIIFVNARMSAKSFATWQKNPRLAQQVFSRISYCFAQDQNAFERFSALGVSRERLNMLGNLKQFQEAVPVDHPDLQAVQGVFPYDKTLCVASTHKGEDQIVLDAFARAKKTRPDLKMILVPRHPNRSAEIAALIAAHGFSYATRSRSELPDQADDIYLADTVGDMSLWYSAAATTFVAGSLVSVGGHTPYEPAVFGSAIIHGSQYSNFQAIYERLVENKGSLQADTGEDIAAAWVCLLEPAARSTQIEAAQATLFDSNDKDKMLDEITSKIEALL
ncbi:MAG: hypothetical protein COB84_00315 [Rhodobacteraceae bacterium]|nr:MAG: hypothetical protein COB84_00315 [Paracoccaceae bacterium]